MDRSSNTSKSTLLDTPLLAKIPSVHSYEELEAIATLISPLEFKKLVEAFSEKIIPIEKLDPLLVGLPSEVFCIALQSIPVDSLLPLTREIFSEPLLHHITILANNCEETHRIYANKIDSLKVQFNHIDREHLDYDSLREFRNEIDDITAYYNNSLEFIAKLLYLAWNSQRISLIQKISALKSDTIFQLTNEVDGDEETSSNLELLLFEELASVFDKANLKDEDSAIDGLAALSVWYLQDYWDAGFFPEIANREDMDIPAKLSMAKKQEYRNQLFQEVIDHLQSIGLTTVGNLKNASIFSKKMLKEFIHYSDFF